MTDRFPKIWVPTPVENDLRQLLWHRQKLVWMRTSVKNQLHALAMSQGVCRKAKLWTEKGRTELEQLALDPWASRRRTELLHLLDHLTASVNELNQAVEEAGQHREDVRLLMTHPGVGRIVALAFALMIGTVERFPSSKQLVSYLGLNPSEHSSGGRQRLGAISKQGNRLMRSLLVEAAQTATRVEPNLRRHYRRLKARRTGAVAKVAIARKLAVRLFWMLRSQADYAQLIRMQGSPGATLVD
jgi:transposase